MADVRDALMDISDPINDAEQRSQARLPEVQPALDAAIAEVGELYGGGDFQRFLVVATDGQRAALGVQNNASSSSSSVTSQGSNTLRGGNLRTDDRHRP